MVEINSISDISFSIKHSGVLQYYPKIFICKNSNNYINIYNKYDDDNVIVIKELFTNISINGISYDNVNVFLNDILKVINNEYSVVTDFNSDVASNKRDGFELWNKFGYNNDLDIGTEVLASFGGTFTPLTTATTISISSTSVNDISVTGTGVRSIVVYGIDENRDEAIEVFQMNGTTPVVSSSLWLGINRVAMFLCGSSTTNDGEINVTATTGGSIMAQMPPFGGVTQQCIFHIPSNYNYNASWLWLNIINRGKDAIVTVKFWVYSAVNNGKQEVFKIDIDTSKTSEPISVNPNLLFPITEKSVCWLECTSDKNDVVINGRFSGILSINS